MAVLANQYDPEKDNQQQQGQTQNNSVSQPINVSGSQAVQSEGGTNGGQTQNSATPQGTSSGRFTNLTSYLKANSGYNPNQGGLAGQVNQNLQDQGNQLQQNVNNAQNDFNTQANANRVQYNSDLVNKATSNPYEYLNGPQNWIPENGMNKNPTPIVMNGGVNGPAPGQPFTQNQPTDPNQANIDAFSQQLNAKYNGPMGIDPNNSFKQQATDYQNLGNAASTENGRYALLRNMFDRPDYSSGQQQLDNLFLQADPNQVAQMQGVRTLANQTGGNINNAINQSATNAANYTNEANQTRQNALSALNGAITGFGDETNPNSYVGQQVAAQNAARNDAFNQLKSRLGSGKISAADSQLLFQNNVDGMQYMNVDPTAYLTQPGTTANRNNVLTQDDINKIQALSKLAGTNPDASVQKILNEYQNSKYDPNAYIKNQPNTEFDLKRFSNDTTNRYKEYQNLAGQANQELNANDPFLFENRPGSRDELLQQDREKIARLNALYGINNKFSIS